MASISLALAWLTAERTDARQAQCPTCVRNGTVCIEAFVSNNDRFFPDNEARAAINEFRDAVLDLMDEWVDLVDWLSYRHMFAYWLGLVHWRQRVYNRNVFDSPFRSAIPQAWPHRLLQTLSARVRLVRATDEDFYTLQCAAFRQVQRERRHVYVARLRGLEKRYGGVVGELYIQVVREECVGRMGFFEVTREFDPDMEILERHLDGDVRFEG
ncbi:hypothetical protein G7Z17_g8780 [Cylindrodendrum hubeiense]|uniref:Uncharacterized protein n=1 Tax=Cylindrodendrum hubeiense TaxID=595255 RepID=A0A9P5H911_9HYPO|nr:hypothetical protein G7Z17_g8780 [Cylindrodendrum hubeiense]